MKPEEILDLKVEGPGVGKTTVRGYLVRLLETLWDERDNFSGKRPFGGSAWEFDLYEALVTAHVVPGKFNDEGFLDEFSKYSQEKADRIIRIAISSLGH